MHDSSGSVQSLKPKSRDCSHLRQREERCISVTAQFFGRCVSILENHFIFIFNLT